MSKIILTQLLEKGELDVRQERLKRPDTRIWRIVAKELGGAYPLSPINLGGMMMGLSSIPEKSIDAYLVSLKKEKIVEGLLRYDKLAKLGEAAIENKYKDLVRLEIEHQQQAYITQCRLEADFPYWLKMPFWTYLEGAALIHGLQPKEEEKIHYHDLTREFFPIIKSWRECREHALRALQAGQLKYNSKPIEFLTWANSLGYPIPEGLQGLFGGSEELTKRVNNESQPVSVITLEKPKRTDALSPLITRAIKECDSYESSAVWNKMCEYARNKVTPLYGIVEEGLQYNNQSDEPKTFNKIALRKRLKRINSPDKSR
jgi:hypothetical protein